MREVQPIDTLERASALLHPLRMRVLQLATRPVSALELARELGETPQKINYHLKELEKAGLLRKVREEKIRNFTKAFYEAKAKSIWFSPRLAVDRRARATRDQVSLHNLLGLSRELERDVLALLNGSQNEGAAAASLGVRAELAFKDGEARRAFLAAYVSMFDGLVRRFCAKPGAPSNDRYTTLLAVYPKRGRGRAGRKKEA